MYSCQNPSALWSPLGFHRHIHTNINLLYVHFFIINVFIACIIHMHLLCAIPQCYLSTNQSFLCVTLFLIAMSILKRSATFVNIFIPHMTAYLECIVCIWKLYVFFFSHKLIIHTNILDAMKNNTITKESWPTEVI